MPRSKTYAVKSVFGPTLQGEGSASGRPCRFLRLAGCNQWDGRQETRVDSACPYCDTDFFGGTKMTADEIVDSLQALTGTDSTWVWISGGEPMLQVDSSLLRALSRAEFQSAIETNGSIPIPPDVRSLLSHVTVSPKVPRSGLRVHEATDLKLLYPHPNPQIEPRSYWDFDAKHFYLQPIDAGDPEVSAENLRLTIEALHHLPGWQLSLQIHKYLGLE